MSRTSEQSQGPHTIGPRITQVPYLLEDARLFRCGYLRMQNLIDELDASLGLVATEASTILKPTLRIKKPKHG